MSRAASEARPIRAVMSDAEVVVYLSAMIEKFDRTLAPELRTCLERGIEAIRDLPKVKELERRRVADAIRRRRALGWDLSDDEEDPLFPEYLVTIDAATAARNRAIERLADLVEGELPEWL